jgi:hypothetical protein
MRGQLYLVAALALVVLPGRAQFFEPQGSFAIEVSLENTSLPRLAMHRSAITSLEVVGDYVVGGTSADSGLSPYLFAASIRHRQLEMVFPLDEAVVGQRSISSGFGRGPNGSLYAGTIPNSKRGGGHLLRVTVQENQIQVRDLGVPLSGEGIFAVTANPKTDMIYGIAWPSGRFFSFHVPDGKVLVYDETAPRADVLKLLSGYLLKPEDYLSRRLVVDAKQRVYGSCPPGRLFRFDPDSAKVEMLGDELPSVAGRKALGRVDAWAVGPGGAIYGANAADAQLFTIDTATGKVTNLGKPAMIPRMKGIAFGRDGVLYGVNGAAPGYSHVFTYQPERGFVDYGNPLSQMTAPGIEQGIPWRGFQIETVAVSADGRYIVMGEAEALSQLMLFEVRSDTLAMTASR